MKETQHKHTPVPWFNLYQPLLFSNSFSLPLASPIHLFPFLTVLLSPLIHLTALSLWVCCDKTKPAAGKPLLCQDGVIAIGRRCLITLSAALNSVHTELCSFHFLFCALWLKIASCLASTPSATNIWNVPQPSLACLPECYLLKYVLTSVVHPRHGLVLICCHCRNTLKHERYIEFFAVLCWFSIHSQACGIP